MQRDIEGNRTVRDFNIPFSTNYAKYEKTHRDRTPNQLNQWDRSLLPYISNISILKCLWHKYCSNIESKRKENISPFPQSGNTTKNTLCLWCNKS